MNKNTNQTQKGLAGLGIMLVILLVGMFGSDAIYKAIDNIGKKPASYTAGTYTAAAQGFGGDVVAVVTVSDKAIESVEVTGDGETDGIGSNAITDLPAAIMEAQSSEVDAVSGATITSTAVKQAVADALTQAQQ